MNDATITDIFKNARAEAFRGWPTSHLEQRLELLTRIELGWDEPLDPENPYHEIVFPEGRHWMEDEADHLEAEIAARSRSDNN